MTKSQPCLVFGLTLAIFAAALLPSEVHAQSEVLRTEGPVGPSLEPFDLQVELDHAVTDGITGWFIALCHDPAHLEILQVLEGPVLDTVAGGEPAMFISTVLLPGEGWTGAMVVDFVGGDRLLPGNDINIYTATYFPTGLGSTTPCFCSGIGQPAAAPPSLLAGDAYYYPDFDCDTVTIDAVGPAFVFDAGISSSTYDFFGGQAVIEHFVSMRELPTAPIRTGVSGVAMALGHDSDQITAVGAEPATDLVELNGGIEPEFWSVNLLPGGIVITAEFSTGTMLEFPETPTQVAAIAYESVPSSWQAEFEGGTVQLDWDNSLGADNQVQTELGLSSPGLFPGSIDLAPEFRRFIRGDCNGDTAINVGDVIHVLEAVFDIDPVPCREACKTNADGTLDLADAIYLAGYLFAAGPPPVFPFPNCNGVAGQDCQFAAACP